MKKYVISAMVAVVALSVASPALADNGRGEGQWKRLFKAERSWKHIDKEDDEDRDERRGPKDGKIQDACRVEARTTLNDAMKAAHQKFMDAKKAARLTRTNAIIAANGDQTKMNAAWSAYQTSFLASWSTYGEAVYTAMKNFGTARGTCMPNPVTKPIASAVKRINSFAFASPSVAGVINEGAHTIALTVPYGTNVTNLIPTISFTGASLSSISGIAKDFTYPVTYVVKAEDASKQSYVVTVTVAPNTAKKITAFSFGTPAAVGVINESALTISLSVPNGTNVTSLTPTVTHTGSSIAPASGVAKDFSSPQAYTVYPASGAPQTYVVTVTVLP